MARLKEGGADIDREIEELKERVAALEQTDVDHDAALADLDERVHTLENDTPVPPDPPDPPDPEPGSTEIPSIPWTAVPADWANVKAAGALGDGVHDDTGPINKLLSELTCFSGLKATVYLPAGVYRITSSLKMPYKEGSAFIGHGKDTTLVWDGPDNGTMFICDSNAFSTFEGITFDGKGKAGVGLDHANVARREIMVMHRHLHFRDFRDTAIRVPDGKPDQRYLAESVFNNILVERAKVGLCLLQHNDYINTVDGCSFYDCEIGIKSHYGLPLVRNTHFERSRDADMTITGISHGRTIRRCTSQGSRMFLRLGESAGWKNALNLMLEDCHIEGWSNVDGAIVAHFRGPTLMFDCTFRVPPPGAKQTVLLANSADYNQRFLWSNCTTEAEPLVNKGPNGDVIEIPAGDRGGCLTDASHVFLKGGTIRCPGRIFPITDYGGSTGSQDIGPAWQQAIDAATAEGNGAWAYLPPGEYNIATTPVATGGNYVIAGSGWKTKLWWKGTTTGGGVMLRLSSPKGITVQGMSLGHDQHGAAVWSAHVISDGSGSDCTFHDIHFRKDFIVCGLFLDGLKVGDRVKVPFGQGRVWGKNSNDAEVLCGHMDYCSFYLEGNTGDRTGIFGIQSGFTPGSEPNLQVKDNLSLVASDLYSEASRTYISASGASGQPSGRITTCAPRMNTAKGQVDIEANNYAGTVSIFASPFDAFGGTAGAVYKVTQQGSRPLVVVYAGNAYLTDPNVSGLPQFQFSNGKAVVAGCIVDSWSGAPVSNTSVPDQIPEDGLEEIAYSLDDLRRLGDLDLRLNYGWGR